MPVCSGCLARGTTCLSQEYPEERDTSSGGQVGERLGRVERLLETLVSKIESYEEEENVHKIMTPESVGNDVLTPYTTTASANPNVVDNAPFISLFDNSVVSIWLHCLPTYLTFLVWPARQYPIPDHFPCSPYKWDENSLLQTIQDRQNPTSPY